jgi:hypothetical protein
MIHMVVDEFAFRVSDGGFDRMELLRKVKAGTPGFHHGDQGTQMPFGPLEPLYDVWMTFMRHTPSYPMG